METIQITTSTELKHKIMQLHALNAEQEEKVTRSFKELYYSLTPTAILQSAGKHFSEDKNAQAGFAKIAVSLGSDYIIGKVLGKRRGIVGYLSSILVHKLSGMVIQKNLRKIVQGVAEKLQGTQNAPETLAAEESPKAEFSINKSTY